MELGEGKPDAHGRVMLPPLELALAIKYALLDHRPDAAFVAAARGESSRLGMMSAARSIGCTEAEHVFKDDHVVKAAAIGRYMPGH